MDFGKEFEKYATKHKGISSTSYSQITSSLTPYIMEERQMNITQMDVFSRLMMDRIIFLGTGINDQVANVIQAQLLFLESVDASKDISIYINSPGGGVYAGLGIYDTMQFIKPDVATICTGMAASMGAVLMCAGAKGKRSALPHSRVMIHQPMSGTQGQVSDMEITIKETINPIPPQPESPTKKILMAPFRILGKVIDAVGSALGPLGRFIAHVIRVVFGLIIFFLGLCLTIAPLIALAVYFGVTDTDYRTFAENFPIQLFTDLVPVWLAVASLGLVFIPGIVILLLGLSVLAQKNLVGGRFGLVALALWLLCIGIAGFHIPKIVAQFKEENTLETKAALPVTSGILILKANDIEDEELFNKANLQIIGVADSVVTLKQEFFARGKSKQDALENAKKLAYNYSVLDSIVTFDEGYDLRSLDSFRDQRIDLTLEIPYDRPFIMERSLLEILRNTIYDNGYRSSDVRPEAVWVFNQAGLICLTCPGEKGDRTSWEDYEEEKTELDSATKAAADSLTRSKFTNAPFMKN